MKKQTIPYAEVEIGENLYLVITDLSYLPSSPGKYTNLPEDCYEEEPAEIDWSDKNCHLMKKKKVLEHEFAYYQKHGIPVKLITKEYEFDCDPNLAYEYYDYIIECIEEGRI